MKIVVLITLLFSWSSFASERILLTGSSTVAPLVDELAKSFERAHKGVRVDVQTGGSTRGIIDARRGVSDIGMISRSLKESESDLKQFTIAIDGIGIIIHKNNPISKLNKRDIVAIFKGQITNWSQLGGPDKRIVVVNKAQGRSTLELFIKYFELKSSEVKSHIIIGDNEQGIKTISAQPWSIGYVSIGTAEFNIAQNTPIKLINMNGVSASVENVKNGSYPLSRKLNLVTSTRPVGIIKKFLDFSRNQVDIIQGQYFVPAN